MTYLLEEDKIAIRMSEIQNIKEELRLEKERLEEEILTKAKEVEKLGVRCQLYETVKRQYIVEGMDGFEENFTKPINKLYNDGYNQLESLRNQNSNKIKQIEYIIYYINNDIKK